MEAKELRIGNFLQKDNNEIFTVSRLDNKDDNDILVEEERGLLTLDYNLYPIPLTEEWLVKFGFTGLGVTQELQLDSHTWLYSARGKNVELVVENEHGNGTDRTIKLLPIKYVHQLQNLYFALTGKELTIK